MFTVKTGTAVVSGAALLVAMFGATVAQAEVDGPKVTWKYNVWGKKRAFTAGVHHIADHVEKETGGKFKIKVFYGDQLGGKKENLDNLKAGAFEMAQMCASYHNAKNETLTVSNLPFLPIKDADATMRAHEAVYAHPATIKEMTDKWNVKILMSSLLPQYEFLGKGKPPTDFGDFKGLSVRALGGLGDAMEKLGARKNTVTATEVYQAIDRGMVSAVSFPFSYAHVSYKIDEVADWFTTNMSPATNDCPTVISLDAWNSLPEQYQKLITDAKPGAYEALKAAYKVADDKNIPMFHKKMTAVTYSEDQLAEFRKIGGKPVWDEWVAKHKDKFPAQELLDSLVKAATGG